MPQKSQRNSIGLTGAFENGASTEQPTTMPACLPLDNEDRGLTRDKSFQLNTPNFAAGREFNRFTRLQNMLGDSFWRIVGLFNI